jgi:hypothetical protein
VLEARDLAERVDAGVCAAGDRELEPLPAENAFERGLQLRLNRPALRLGGPARKAGPVVRDLETSRQTSSRKTISVESERRWPSLTILV